MSNIANEKKAGMDRRDFIKTAVAAGAAFSTANFVHAQNLGDQINVALLGCGAQGKVLQEACDQITMHNLRFKAVCDIWEKYNLPRVGRRLRRKHDGLQMYVDYQEMLDKEKDLDAVIIATPDFWHSTHACACMEAGLNVYCEKEMSNTLEGARKMVETARKTGKLLQIGHQRRSNPRYQHAYEKLIKQDQVLGRITTVNGQWNRSAKPFKTVPEKLHMDQAKLKQYGFDSMEQFLNWRWYKGKGGGPIVDLGSHQIDIFSWFLEANPTAVVASGGTDYYDKKTHEWYDTVMAIYEYQTKEGPVRAFYQTLTTNGYGGYYELFMGINGTLDISESAGRGKVYRDLLNTENEQWEQFVAKGVLEAPIEPAKEEKTEAVLDVRESPEPPSYAIPVSEQDKTKLYHQWHLENFFSAVKGKAKLNCPAEIGYETAVAVLKVNDAVEAQKRLTFADGEFHV